MSKRFIVLLASETEAQTNAFAAFLKGKGGDKIGWWHWLQNSWLIVDLTGTLESPDLIDELNKIYPGVHKFVTQLKGDDFWSGYGPRGEKGMFTWLTDTWKKPVLQEKSSGN